MLRTAVNFMVLPTRQARLTRLAETVSCERRGDQLGSGVAEVNEGSHVRELLAVWRMWRVWRVEDSSEDCIFCSL